MAPWAKPVSVSIWFLSLCFVTLAVVHRVSYLHVITPQAASGLPKWLNILKADDLLLSAYDSDTGRLVPRNGNKLDKQDFWRLHNARCVSWNSLVQTEYLALVQEVNTSTPQAEPYYMQILKICEQDDATGAIRTITRYALNGEDVLQHRGDQNHWFSVHPAVWRVAERWNRGEESFAVTSHITSQRCMALIESTRFFITGKTAQPTVHVALVPGTQTQPRRLICHVTGFYPHDIEVTWERGGQVALGEQLTSGILPNGDPTFQIQVSLELGQEGPSPTEHVCVVRHSSLGNTTQKVIWDSQPPGQPGVLLIVLVCILIALAIGVLGLFLWKRPGAWKQLYHPARTQPGTLDSPLATAKSLGGSSSTTSCSDDTG